MPGVAPSVGAVGALPRPSVYSLVAGLQEDGKRMGPGQDTIPGP